MSQSGHDYPVLRGQIEKLLERLPENNEQQRSALYERMRRFAADKHPHHLILLEEVIGEVEAGYRDAVPPDVDVTPETERNDLVDNAPPAPTSQTPVKRNGTPLVAIVAGVAALVAVAAAGWFYLGGATAVSSTGPTIATDWQTYSLSPTNLAPLPAEADGYRILDADGARLFEADGPAYLFQIEPVEIDPAKTYRVSVRLRVTRDDPEIGGARTYAGVATYDSDGQLQRSPPGLHRYPAMVNRIISEQDGWVEAEGLITGAGDENHNQFRLGTVTVRPAVLLNYQSSGAVSQLDYLRFEEVLSP